MAPALESSGMNGDSTVSLEDVDVRAKELTLQFTDGSARYALFRFK